MVQSDESSEPGLGSKIPSSSLSSLPDRSYLWKTLTIFITVDILIWILVRRYVYPKKTKERFQHEFSSWIKDAYEQQQHHHQQPGRTNNWSSQSRARASQSMKFHHPSPRAIDKHLDILGISKISGIAPKEAEIKNAYRKICLQTHPDVLGSDHPDKQRAEQKFIEATASYNFLLEYLRK
jgi:hypothetical protein